MVGVLGKETVDLCLLLLLECKEGTNIIEYSVPHVLRVNNTLEAWQVFTPSQPEGGFCGGVLALMKASAWVWPV